MGKILIAHFTDKTVDSIIRCYCKKWFRKKVGKKNKVPDVTLMYSFVFYCNEYFIGRVGEKLLA